MATPSQILANRTNSQSSTGPVTAAGKAASSQNNRKHGFYSLKLFFTCPEQEQEFNEIHQGFLDTYCPVGEPEERKVHHLTVLHIHTMLLHNDASEEESLLLERIEEQRRSAGNDPNDRLRGHLLEAQANDKTFQDYMRRARFLQSSTNATTRELLRLQAERRLREQKAELAASATAPQPEPAQTLQLPQKPAPACEIGFVPSELSCDQLLPFEPLLPYHIEPVAPSPKPRTNSLPAPRRRWR